MSDPVENGMACLDGLYLVDKGKPACLIYALDPKQLEIWKQANSGQHLAWVETTNFKAAANEVLLLPDSAGGCLPCCWGWGAKPTRLRWPFYRANYRRAITGSTILARRCGQNGTAGLGARSLPFHRLSQPCRCDCQ